MTNQTHIFFGNLTRDPEIKTGVGPNKDGTVASFSVAVNGRKPEDTVFCECEVWGDQAEFLAKWFKKGSGIAIWDAEMKSRKWEEKTFISFRVNRLGFLGTGGKKDKATDSGDEATEEAPTPTSKPAAPKRNSGARKTTPVEDDADIPF